MDFLKESKCRCGHLYDFYNDGPKPKEKYFYPPTRHGPFWFDKAKIYQLDPMEDFIRNTFKDALKSNEATVRYNNLKIWNNYYSLRYELRLIEGYE